MRRWGWGVALLCMTGTAIAVEPVEVEVESRSLVFGFAESMQTLHLQTGVPLVTFVPKLDVEACAWMNDTTLRCDLKENAPRATRFRATLSPSLLTTSGARLPSSSVEFESARPTLSVARHFDENGLTIFVESWKDIPPQDIARVLRMRIDGKPVVVDFDNKGDWGRTLRWHLALPRVEHESVLELSVVPGLVSKEGPLPGTQNERLARVVIGEPLQVRGAACAGATTALFAPVKDGRIDLAGCTPDEEVRVLFSRTMARNPIAAWVKTLPAGVKASSGGGYSRRDILHDARLDADRAAAWSLGLEIDAPLASTTIEIPALLANGESTQPVTLHVETGHSRPAFVAPFTQALLKRDADPGLRAVNAPPVPVDVMTIARDITQGSMRSPQGDEEGVRVDLPAVRRAVNEGGFAAIVPHRFADETSQRDRVLGRMHVAAPDFDVEVRFGNRTLLAWANAWEGDAPIDGARATLLFDDGETGGPCAIAHAITDADGVALLRIPDDFTLPTRANDEFKGRWYLRMERAAQRAVLPVATVWGNTLGDARELAAFGVTDRPIYRAGDTAHWTAWLRESRDGRHVAPGQPTTRTLKLVGVEEAPVLTWSQTFDAQGVASGDVRIPIHVPDGEYCINDDARVDLDLCFHVGTFRAQDLWARASTKQERVDRGALLSVDIEAGFYSGGSGAGLAIVESEVSFHGESPQWEFAQWRKYTFAQPKDTYAEMEIAEAPRTDAKGHATLAFRVMPDASPEKLPFGTMHVTAEARPADRDGTVTNDVRLRYAAYPAYVGVKLDLPLDATSPVSLTGVVIDADGKGLPPRRIAVEVGYRPFARTQDTPNEIVHRCTLMAGTTTDCTFPRKRGVYTFIARSGDAAPAELSQHVYEDRSSGRDNGEETPKFEASLLGKAEAGKPMRVMLRSPFVPARVLVMLRRGADILEQRVVHLTSPMQVVEMGAPRVTTAGLRLDIVARRVDTPARVNPLPAGFREPAFYASERIELEFDAPVDTKPVSLAFERTQAAPADTVRLVVRNDSATARGVTLTITDDAVRALGKHWVERVDPVDYAFRSRAGDGWISTAGFANWNGESLRWVLARVPDLKCSGADCLVTVVGNAAFNPIDVSSVESVNVLTAEQIAALPVSRDVTSVALLAPGTVRGGATELDSVETTGSSEVDEVVVVGAGVIQDGQVRDPDAVDAAAQRQRDADDDARIDLARIRERFVDTALWVPHFTLAPGESRTFDVVVPDNLTRWRAVAWSHDDADDFAKAEATLEAGLPLEARLQAPVRLYPGDTTRIAANVRQTADHASNAKLRITLDGKPVRDATIAVPANGQASDGVSFAPTSVGTVRVVAAAATAQGRDAVTAPIEIASTTILGTRTQAGWIGDAPVSLALPTLPHGAHDARVEVSVWRGTHALVDGWTDAMREYPHRCWEQILSRAVAAALAIERGDKRWPDAKAVVQEALDNAGAFQSMSGAMRYFNGESDHDYDYSEFNVPLTAYTVDAFELLRSLGYPVNEEVDVAAREFLQGNAWDAEQHEAASAESRAIAAAVVDLPVERQKKVVVDTRMDLPGKVAAARALARTNAPQARTAIDALLTQAPLRGGARSLARGSRWDRWMSSPMREQCELIRLLEEFPQFAPAGARDALVAGLADLYAGGVADLDTQSSASCLRALRKDARTEATTRVIVDATVASQTARLDLAPGQVRASNAFAMPEGGAVSIAPVERGDAPVAYVTRVAFDEDARTAERASMGFSITRLYEVKRAGKWVPIGQSPLRDNDWVRITLTVDSEANRFFVAVTDDLPGGLRPVDMDLDGVAGVGDAYAFGGWAWAFDQRKLDPRKPKFYAQVLPAGKNQIVYYARVANTGDYLAAPAVAELMYGEASRARTAADRIRIQSPGKP